MSQALSIEERILDRLFQQLEADNTIPREVIRRIHALRQSGRLKDVDAILDAIRDGVKDHAKNSSP
jgi:hypothetical protein